MIARRLAAVAATTALAVTPLPAAHATADEAAPVLVAAQVVLDVPGRPDFRSRAPYTVRVRDADDGAVSGATVHLDRHLNGTWTTIQTRRTDESGQVSGTVWIDEIPDGNVFRARTEPTTDDPEPVSDEVTVRATRIPSTLALGGDARFVDDRERARLTLSWRAGGAPVSGRVVLERRYAGSGQWNVARTPRVRNGQATVTVWPSQRDSYWRVKAPYGVWHQRDVSNRHYLNNVPPGRVLRLPKAPAPRITLPAQPAAVGGGLSPRTTRISQRVWNDMTGRSWHRGCPVGRGALRLVRMNYWGFDGYRHRGELVVSDRAAGRAVAVFRSLYRMRTPIRAMYRVDRFGWSSRLQGADDYASMAADNTSAFNCRRVVGNPSATSPHSYGGAIDVNPWENPYVSRTGTVPNTWWLGRSHPQVAWRSYQHPVVRAFTRQGFSWGGAYRDYHHWQRGMAERTTSSFGLE